MVIIPAYNEGKNIEKTIENTLKVTDNICVIDDGSIDNTYELASKFDIKTIKHEKNKGKGAAIRTGISCFLESNSEIAIFMDGDGQHNPEDLQKFVKLFNEKPDISVIVGSRFGTNEWQSNMPFPRKLSNLLSRFGLWVLYNGLVIEDPQNGFRAYRREVLKCIRFSGARYEAETEIIIDSYLKGFKISKVYMSSSYSEDAESYFSLFKDTWTIPGVMWKLFFKRKPFLLRTQKKRLAYRKAVCK